MAIINGLHFNHIKGDIFGGLTSAAVALPLALAFGVLSGAGPLAGLYGAIFVGFFTALTGSTATQISGPTGPMTVIMTAIFMQYTIADPVHGAAIAFTVVMLGGLFQILFGALKLGPYFCMIPHPVISGLMSGIGITIILFQLGPLLGHSQPFTALEAFASLPSNVAHPATESALVGILALIIVYFQPASIGKYIPSPLTALLVGSTTYLLLFPDSMVKTVGEVYSGLPVLQWPTFTSALILDMLKSGLALAVLGTISSLMSALVTDNINRTHHNPNRELIGQGIGNLAAGLSGGLPGAGASMRTVRNVRAGAKSRFSGMFHALTILVLLMFASDLTAHIPHAVLAGILLKVAADLIDWDYIKRLHKSPKPAIVIMYTVLLITVFVDMMLAFGVGITMASLLFMKRMSDLQLEKTSTITHPDEEHPLSAEEKDYMKRAAGRILLFHVSGPMSFGAAKSMVKRVASVDNYEALVLDLSDVPMIDFTSSLAIEDIILDAQEAGHHIFISGAKRGVKEMLETQGIMALLLQGHCFDQRVDALKQASHLLENGA